MSIFFFIPLLGVFLDSVFLSLSCPPPITGTGDRIKAVPDGKKYKVSPSLPLMMDQPFRGGQVVGVVGERGGKEFDSLSVEGRKQTPNLPVLGLSTLTQ